MKAKGNERTKASLLARIQWGAAAVADPRVNTTGKTLVPVLMWMAHETKNSCNPSIATLGKLIDRTEKTAFLGLKSLTDALWLLSSHSKGSAPSVLTLNLKKSEDYTHAAVFAHLKEERATKSNLTGSTQSNMTLSESADPVIYCQPPSHLLPMTQSNMTDKQGINRIINRGEAAPTQNSAENPASGGTAAWQQQLAAIGCRMPKVDLPIWQILVETHGLAAVMAEAREIDSDKRYHDRVAGRLTPAVGSGADTEDLANKVAQRVRQVAVVPVYVNADTLLNFFRICGPKGMTRLVKKAKNLGKLDDTILNEGLAGSRSIYGENEWETRPIERLLVAMTDAQIAESLARTKRKPAEMTSRESRESPPVVRPVHGPQPDPITFANMVLAVKAIKPEEVQRDAVPEGLDYHDPGDVNPWPRHGDELGEAAGE